MLILCHSFDVVGALIKVLYNSYCVVSIVLLTKDMNTQYYKMDMDFIVILYCI